MAENSRLPLSENSGFSRWLLLQNLLSNSKEKAFGGNPIRPAIYNLTDRSRGKYPVLLQIKPLLCNIWLYTQHMDIWKKKSKVS